MMAVNFAWAQGTQYFMNSLPQYNTNNPAFIPKYKFALGIPGSMIDVNYFNSDFSYNDLVEKTDGRYVTSPLRLNNAIRAKTYITGTTQFDLFRLGLQISDKSYLMLNSAVRGYSHTMIPQDAVAIFGGSSNPYMGKVENITLQSDMSLFWENSVGLAFTPVEKLTVGARVKILNGLMNAGTTTANATIYNGPDSVSLAATLNARTSGIQNRTDGFHLSNYSGNHGFAIDLGATFKPVEKLTLAASLLDIGSIHWRNNVYQYTLDPSKANYQYTKSDIDRVLNDDQGSGAIVDTLKSRFRPQEKRGSAYSTMLPAKMMVSANYDFGKNFSMGGMFFAQRYTDHIATGMTLAANKHFGKVISTTLSYSIYERSYKNLGAGISLNFTPIQIYLVGDNILLSRVNNQTITARGGVNFVWGWRDDRKIKVKAPPPDKKAVNLRKKRK